MRITATDDFLWMHRFIQRFRVNRETGCWEWIRGKTSSGYGSFYYRSKRQQAQRVSWQLFVGKFPAHLWVLHKCDNKACVNPDHLFLGTRLDNIRDMDAKGRRVTLPPRGENSGQSKLTHDQASRIIELYETGRYYQHEIAAMFGVGKGAVSKIMRGETWACLGRQSQVKVDRRTKQHRTGKRPGHQKEK